jgi:DNA modification methylase
LFTKQPDYYFDRTAIDVPSRASSLNGVRANAGSVWSTQCEVVADTDPDTEEMWRINPEASPYRHVAMWPRALVRQMLLPTTREGDAILDPFAGSGTTGEVAFSMGRRAILIEASASAQKALADRVGNLHNRLL